MLQQTGSSQPNWLQRSPRQCCTRGQSHWPAQLGGAIEARHTAWPASLKPLHKCCTWQPQRAQQRSWGLAAQLLCTAAGQRGMALLRECAVAPGGHPRHATSRRAPGAAAVQLLAAIGASNGAADAGCSQRTSQRRGQRLRHSKRSGSVSPISSSSSCRQGDGQRKQPGGQPCNCA